MSQPSGGALAAAGGHAGGEAGAAPPDPIAAVTHPDPYPYLARLVARSPLYHDAALGLWVAAGAEPVTAVLSSGLCHVRPPAEPVPRALLGSPAAEIFRRLVRMTDGPRHAPLKQGVSAALAAIGGPRAAELSRACARALIEEARPQTAPDLVPDFAFRLPVHTVASLLGVPRDAHQETALWMADFVRCIAPAGSAEQIERGKAAAGHLLDLFRALLAAPPAPAAPESLLAALAREGAGCGRDELDAMDAVAANGIGLLFQAYEATAGLIGNTLRALAVHRDARQRVAAEPSLLQHAVQEVLRYDPPVQNTRRFVAGSGVVAGQAMTEGDAVLVVLAAANRDPSANADPDRFDMFRKDRRTFTLGAGSHRCPGEALAATIAAAGVGELLLAGLDLDRLTGPVSYRESANTRIPIRFHPIVAQDSRTSR